MKFPTGLIRQIDRDLSEHAMLHHNTAMRRLTTGIHSWKCVVRPFRRCANIIECTYTHLESIVHYTPRLCGIAYCS